MYILAAVIFAPLLALTLWSFYQRPHSGLRIFGPIYLTRFFAEWARPKITQYLENPGDGRPYSLVKRSWVYRAAKGLPTTEGFGTTKDLHQSGTHTIRPAPFGILDHEMPNNSFRVPVGGRIGSFHVLFPAMRSGGSFGAFGAAFTRAMSDAGALLNEKIGEPSGPFTLHSAGFLDNTGEGGLAPHHCPVTPEAQGYLDRLTERAREQGHDYTFRFDRTATPDGRTIEVPLQLNRHYIDGSGRVRVRHSGIGVEYGASEMPRHLIVQIGPSLAGFRLDAHDELDMDFLNYTCGLSFVAGIEIKGQQGAKPNDGGRVQKEKLTPELRAIRGFHGSSDYVSPERHPFIPDESLAEQVAALVEKIEAVRHLPNFVRRGLIIGYKMTYCGPEFLEHLAQHLRKGRGPDYLVVDGAEGGTGAGDPIMTDHMGVHTYQGVHLTHTILSDLGVRDRIRLVASGRISDPGDIAVILCLGADYVNIMRGYMMAAGCIQARECNSGKCPSGITTHSAWRQRGLDPELKAVRIANYGLALRDKTMKLARAAGVRMHKGEKFTLDHLDVVTGVGKLTIGSEVYQPPKRGANKVEVA